MRPHLRSNLGLFMSIIEFTDFSAKNQPPAEGRRRVAAKAPQGGGCAANRRRQRKPARPWPLLKKGQDPNALPARVAFHLRRLRLTGKALRDCGFCGGQEVTEIAQARYSMTERDANQLAKRLDISPDELLRDLTEEEKAEWLFYRLSAADPEAVWSKAKAAWKAAEKTDTAAARIMELDRTVVSRNSKSGQKRGYRVLHYGAAQKLAAALKLPRGAWAFLPD